jgi:RsiW-degrading membrane proteinase PrsW (M82 family)
MKFIPKSLYSLLIVFLVITALIVTCGSLFVKYNIDGNVLLAANIIFLLLGIYVFFMQQKALKNSNPNVFVRSIISGMMIKMFGTVIAVLIYVLANSKSYNKKAVFISMFMYLIYLAVEVIAISKINKGKNA